MVLLLRSPVFLIGPPGRVVVAHSFLPGEHPVRSDLERRYRPCGGSHRPPWCSLAEGGQSPVPDLATHSVLDQTHNKAHQLARLSTTYSFPRQSAVEAVSPPQAVAVPKPCLHDHDR